MLNLLPPESKAQIIRMYRIRLAIVVLIFLLALIGFATLFLLPTLYLAVQRETLASTRIAELGMEESTEAVEETTQELVDLKSRLALIDALRSTRYPMDVVGEIVKLKPDKISLRAIDYTIPPSNGVKDEGGSVLIRGTAGTRDLLVQFRDALKATRFSSVNLPIENLAENRNIDFTITITGGF